jgi:hypothetical protein
MVGVDGVTIGDPECRGRVRDGYPLPRGSGVNPENFFKYWQEMSDFVHFWVRFALNNC